MELFWRAFLILGVLNCIVATSDFDLEDGVDDDPELLFSRNVSDVQYLLWTRSNPASEDFYILEVDDLDNLNSSPFDGSKRTYFFAHGWGSTGEDQWILNSKTNILSLEDVNIISIDYRELSDSINYNAAVKNMYAVANYTASYIDWLTESTALTASNIHIIGHSLGGELAGMTGKYVTAGLVDRVTALDPAGPLFYNKSSDERIDKSDASFVDVIHTNACPLYRACYGLFAPTGHVNFYPNGGSHQAGCMLPGNVTGEIWFDWLTGCSHGRSCDYFVESILVGEVNGTTDAFVSWPCSDWDTYAAGGCPDCGQGCLNMGFHVSRSLPGSYYLSTNHQSPFAKGDVQ